MINDFFSSYYKSPKIENFKSKPYLSGTIVFIEANPLEISLSDGIDLDKHD